MELDNIRKCLQTYSVEEIADHNDILVEDLVQMLVEEYNWQLPKPEPL